MKLTRKNGDIHNGYAGEVNSFKWFGAWNILYQRSEKHQQIDRRSKWPLTVVNQEVHSARYKQPEILEFFFLVKYSKKDLGKPHFYKVCSGFIWIDYGVKVILHAVWGRCQLGCRCTFARNSWSDTWWSYFYSGLRETTRLSSFHNNCERSTPFEWYYCYWYYCVCDNTRHAKTKGNFHH